MASDTKSLIELAVRRFLEEVPALQNLKLVAGLELRGRGDVQLYRVEVPGPQVTKEVRGDERVRLSLPRSHFNELAREGRVRHWREAFEHGHVKASGPPEIVKLIDNVVGRQEERARPRKPRGGAARGPLIARPARTGTNTSCARRPRRAPASRRSAGSARPCGGPSRTRPCGRRPC